MTQPLTDEDTAAAVATQHFLWLGEFGSFLALAAIKDHVDPARLVPGAVPVWIEEAT